MIWIFLVHLVRREISRPNTKPRREPPNATTKKETGERERGRRRSVYEKSYFHLIQDTVT